ncbi:MAG: hypothetical protein KAW92_10955 [Candidatus Cloacimonetes bacterium]|nr:hypothetical protein [Candidatus Cloacimonadota bacterium]
MTYYARRKGENYGSDNNKVDNCVANVWTQFGLIEDTDLVIHFQAIYFNCPSGSLQIRDAYGDIIYNTSILSAMIQPDILNYPLTVRLPLEYFSTASGSSIRIFGEFT